MQLENGVGAMRERGQTVYDLPETRVRFGVATCTEVLVDLPDDTGSSRRGGVNGASDVAPAIKHQFQDLPEGLSLFGVAGIALPTGDKAIAGRGPMPYLQAPATYDIGHDLTLNGMYSITFRPDDTQAAPVHQTSFYLDRAFPKADLFVEFVNSYQHGEATENSVDFGGSYRFQSLRQIDFKLGFGVNRAAPVWYATIGYSLRFDHIF